MKNKKTWLKEILLCSFKNKIRAAPIETARYPKDRSARRRRPLSILADIKGG